MQSHPKFRLFIVVLAVVCLLGVLVVVDRYSKIEVAPPRIAEVTSVEISTDRVPSDKLPNTGATNAKVANDWETEKDHAFAPATDFYVAPNDPEVELDSQLKYNEHQVSLVSITRVYLLQDGDLLGNYCLLGSREFVTEQQVLEAQLLAKQYDAKLKELRRQRAAILEQAGVTIDDPEEELALIRAKAFSVYFKARRRILKEVLDAEQRKQINQKYWARQAEIRRIKEEKQTADKIKASKQ